jgi:hypothetical protein
MKICLCLAGALLVGCCRFLQELSTLWADGGIDTHALEKLLRLRKLTKLGVGGQNWDDDAAEGVLARMTGGLVCTGCLGCFVGEWVGGSVSLSAVVSCIVSRCI